MVCSSFSLTMLSSIWLQTAARMESKEPSPFSLLYSMAVTAKKLDAVSEPKNALRLMGRLMPIDWVPGVPPI